MDQNEDIFIRFMNDPTFQKIITGWLSSETYKKLRGEVARHEPAKLMPSGVQR
ncbi:MAG: hypothetical protein ABSH52_23380 [Terriglobia bacterium]|jgi:type I restriction enzyme R subunit